MMLLPLEWPKIEGQSPRYCGGRDACDGCPLREKNYCGGCGSYQRECHRLYCAGNCNECIGGTGTRQTKAICGRAPLRDMILHQAIRRFEDLEISHTVEPLNLATVEIRRLRRYRVPLRDYDGEGAVLLPLSRAYSAHENRWHHSDERTVTSNTVIPSNIPIGLHSFMRDDQLDRYENSRWHETAREQGLALWFPLIFSVYHNWPPAMQFVNAVRTLLSLTKTKAHFFHAFGASMLDRSLFLDKVTGIGNAVFDWEIWRSEATMRWRLTNLLWWHERLSPEVTFSIVHSRTEQLQRIATGVLDGRRLYTIVGR